MMPIDLHILDTVREAVQKSQKIFVITGAGVSAESGVPTFRSPGGFWRNLDPAKVATPEAFQADPALVWQWYDERRIQLLGVQPNPAHAALAHLERNKREFFLLTQNVDDLHERAGSAKISHIHGKIWEVRCLREGRIREDRRAPLPELPPRCEQCGSLERPNVVWFGEMIEAESVQRTERFLESGKIDVVMVIGTESSFGYILDWARRAGSQSGCLIEINPGKTALTPAVDFHLQGPASEILPLIG
jgi:NAD-dependent deacetylase